MSIRSTWFAGAAGGGISDDVVGALQTAIAAAQSKADASMARANSAMSKANSVESTATTAATTASSAATVATSAVQSTASLSDVVSRLDAAQVAADGVHGALQQRDSELQAAIDGLASRVKTIALGYGQLTSLLALGASVDLTLTLSHDMGSTTYNVETSSFPAATITTKTRTRTSVTVTIKAAALALAVGTPIIAVAWA
jgi:hypothetical protein